MKAKSFSEILSESRWKKGLSQRELAELAEINYPYLSRLENGREERRASNEEIQAIAHALEIDSNEFARLYDEAAAVVCFVEM